MCLVCSMHWVLFWLTAQSNREGGRKRDLPCFLVDFEENGSYEEVCRLLETEGNRGNIDNYG